MHHQVEWICFRCRVLRFAMYDPSRGHLRLWFRGANQATSHLQIGRSVWAGLVKTRSPFTYYMARIAGSRTREEEPGLPG